MAQLGFTFYQQDWWSSDTFFELTPIQRYIYLESLFVMYSNDGCMKQKKMLLEGRLRMQISDDDWNEVTSKFIIEGEMFTHISVNKRLRKAVANRVNGTKGGRPKKEDNKTQKTQLDNPKETQDKTQNNPPFKIESKLNIKEIEYNRELDFENSVLSFFDFSEFPHHHKQQSLLSQFCRAKILSGEYEYFKQQFKDYSAYIVKENKQKYRQSLTTFLGDPKNAFEDGKWNSENWGAKIIPIQQPYTPNRRKVIDHSKL